jgi:anti-sigma factor ChrR (cupin superfamily)
MSGHVESWLAEYALGSLSKADAQRIERHVAECLLCAAELDRWQEALGQMPLALTPLEPPAHVGSQLALALMQEQKGPFHGFLAEVAQLFDVALDQGQRLLAQILDPTAWSAGPNDDIGLLHIQGGPRVALADAGFVRMAPGAAFPHHRHGGDERAIILQGSYRDSDGTVYGAGAVHRMAAGTDHDFIALAEGCLFAAVAEGGLTFDSGYVL